jgi:hypothetical protein
VQWIPNSSRMPPLGFRFPQSLETVEQQNIHIYASHLNLILQVLRPCRSLKMISVSNTRNADNIVQSVSSVDIHGQIVE